MALFRLHNDKVVLGDPYPEADFTTFVEDLLSEHALRNEPIPFLVRKFFDSFLVSPANNDEQRWAGYSFWDYDSQKKLSRLVSVEGINLEKTSEYPRSLGEKEGIVGMLSYRYASKSDTQPHVSHDFSYEELLTAKEVVQEKLGFHSGIALPISLARQFAGIFKIYFRPLIDPAVTSGSPLLVLACKRLSIILRLAQNHFAGRFTLTVSRYFRNWTIETVAEEREQRLKRFKEVSDDALQEMNRILGAQAAQIHVFRKGQKKKKLLTEFVKDQTVSSTSQPLSIPLRRGGVSTAEEIGSLEIQGKSSGRLFSTFDLAMAEDGGRLLSVYLSRYLDVEDLFQTANRRLTLLQISSQLSVGFLEASTVEDLIETLVEGVKKDFSFTNVTFVETGDSRLEKTGKQALKYFPTKIPYQDPTFVEDGERFVIPLSTGRKNIGGLELRMHKNREINPDEMFVLEAICNLAGQALWSREVMAIIDNIARDEAKAALARDIVHELTATQSAILTRLDTTSSTIDKIEKNASDRSFVKNHARQLNERVDRLTELARVQHNTLYRYRRFSTATPNDPEEEVDLEVVLKNVAAMLSYRARTKKVKIKTQEIRSVPKVTWYRAEAYLVFVNLVDNAVKSSRKGGKVMLSLKQENGVIVARVRDFGVGIHPNDHAKIWEVGYSTIAPGAKERTSGLGLPAVEQAIGRNLRARIEMKSQKDRFTEFTVYFGKITERRKG